jgi:hypothetical protein
MSTKTAARPARQAKQDATRIDMDEFNAFIDEYINSGVPEIYEFETNERGYAVIPADFPAEWLEAWDGENVRKV